MIKQLLRFGPALIILLAALIYAGATTMQHNQVAVPQSPRMATDEAANFTLPMPRPPKAECDALWHYTPSVSVMMMGGVTGLKGNVLTFKNENGEHSVNLTSTTRIIGYGKRKPQAMVNADMDAFNKLARVCNDGTRVYMAPTDREEITLTLAALKRGKPMQIFMDETDISKNQVAGIILMQPLKP